MAQIATLPETKCVSRVLFDADEGTTSQEQILSNECSVYCLRLVASAAGCRLDQPVQRLVQELEAMEYGNALERPQGAV
jgi:hypothetical protein